MGGAFTTGPCRIASGPAGPYAEGTVGRLLASPQCVNSELYLVDHQLGEEGPYERLPVDAMAGDGALFTQEDAVEAAWAVVDRVLKTTGAPTRTGRGAGGPERRAL